METEPQDEQHRHGGIFDRVAAAVAAQVAHAWFFTLCVGLVIVWAPSIIVIKDVDSWQLIINSTTTVVTFLLVALLQNTQERTTAAMQHKLDALAEGLALVLDQTDGVDESGEQAKSLRDIAGVAMEASSQAKGVK